MFIKSLTSKIVNNKLMLKLENIGKRFVKIRQIFLTISVFHESHDSH